MNTLIVSLLAVNVILVILVLIVITGVVKIMAAIDNLKTALAKETTVEQSVVLLLQTLSADLKAALAGGNDADVQAVADAMSANADSLSAAIVANTPAAPSV